MTTSTPPGWYPSANDPRGTERYWDGSAWTDQSRPANAAAPSPADARAQAAAAKAYAKAQRNWFARHKILTGVGALIVVAIIATAASSGNGKNVPAASDQTGSITNSTTTGGAAPPAKAGTVLLTVRGNGSKSTQKFTAASDWDLAYSYNCHAFGQAGNFQVYVYGSDGAPSLSNDGPNVLGMSGSDVTHEHNGGTYYLTINSECAWTVKVTSA